MFFLERNVAFGRLKFVIQTTSRLCFLSFVHIVMSQTHGTLWRHMTSVSRVWWYFTDYPSFYACTQFHKRDIYHSYYACLGYRSN
jgi:hypothetical protein